MLKTDAKNGKPGYGSAAAFPFVLQFPNPLNPREIQVQVHPGLTVRDYFAGQVLSGAAATWMESSRELAELAYRIADAMIAARGYYSTDATTDAKGFPYTDGQH